MENSGNRINTGDINVDRGDWNVDVDGGYGCCGWGSGVGAGFVAGAVVGGAVAYGTAAAITYGSMYYALPPGCPMVHTYATPYYHCGGYYYQEQMQGDDVVYVVVQP